MILYAGKPGGPEKPDKPVEALEDFERSIGVNPATGEFKIQEGG